MPQIELPPIFIGAQPDFGSNPTTGSPPTNPPMPPSIAFSSGHGAMKVFANGTSLFTAANKGLVHESMIKLLEGLNGLAQNKIQQQLTWHASISRALAARAEKNGNLLRFKTASLTELNYGKAWFDYARKPMNTSGSYVFFGTPIMAAAGIYYWLFGEGKDRNIHIGSLYLSLATPDFKPVAKALDSNGPGTYQINESFTMNTFDHFLNWWAAFLIGRVSGNVTGILTIEENGAYTFKGSYVLNPDTFDADISKRSRFQESATDFLRLLGETFGHTDYKINIIGSEPIEFSGSK